MQDNPPHQDLLIVGAGLAGLHCALQLSHQHPSWSIVIAEAYGYVGGRVVTHYEQKSRSSHLKSIHWENGAGRIHSSHHHVRKYIDTYDLTLIPISSESAFRSIQTPAVIEKDRWPAISTLLYELLKPLPTSILMRHTLRSILCTFMPERRVSSLLLRFPYRGEVETLRADLALPLLQSELKSMKGFYCVKEGLGELIRRMRHDLESRNVQFLFHHRLESIEDGIAHFKTPTGITSISSRRTILALHASALRSIHPFRSWSVLRHIHMEPLTRIYAIFPSHRGISWFSDIPKTITDGRIRYFIPIDPAKGVAMISYVEGSDTGKQGEWGKDPSVVLANLRTLFPEKHIPEPLVYKVHPWTDGCSYWLPIAPHQRFYDPSRLSVQALRPFPKRLPTVFVCGESFSTHQAWMEGALEHASLLLKTYSHLL